MLLLKRQRCTMRNMFHVREGQSGLNQIAAYVFHIFLVEVQTNGGLFVHLNILHIIRISNSNNL